MHLARNQKQCPIVCTIDRILHKIIHIQNRGRIADSADRDSCSDAAVGFNTTSESRLRTSRVSPDFMRSCGQRMGGGAIMTSL